MLVFIFFICCCLCIRDVSFQFCCGIFLSLYYVVSKALQLKKVVYSINIKLYSSQLIRNFTIFWLHQNTENKSCARYHKFIFEKKNCIFFIKFDDITLNSTMHIEIQKMWILFNFPLHMCVYVKENSGSFRMIYGMIIHLERDLARWRFCDESLLLLISFPLYMSSLYASRIFTDFST